MVRPSRDQAPVGFDLQLAREQVRAADPDLLAHCDTEQLVNLGLEMIAEITHRFGTPHHPRWACGSYETMVVMTYHNGGDDGHTSVGDQGCGVPANVLRLAAAVNQAAATPMISPRVRAAAFAAACAHDLYQLCGRMLMPEGQGANRGDERLSAREAARRLRRRGLAQDLVALVQAAVLATAYHPVTHSQNLDYTSWAETSSVPEVIVAQELVAGADLLSLATQWAPLEAMRYAAESLGFHSYGQVAGQWGRRHGVRPGDVTTPQAWFAAIDEDQELASHFRAFIKGQEAYLRTHFSFSDRGLRALCGQGIDDMFAQRQANADWMARRSALLQAGQLTAAQMWQQAHAYAAMAGGSA